MPVGPVGMTVGVLGMSVGGVGVPISMSVGGVHLLGVGVDVPVAHVGRFHPLHGVNFYHSEVINVFTTYTAMCTTKHAESSESRD